MLENTGNGSFLSAFVDVIFIRRQLQLAQRIGAAFQGHALEVFGERGAAVVFADDFSRRFQTQEIFVRGDADGVRFGGGTRDSPYFPANLFPSRSVGAFSVAGPCQGVGDLMQNRVTDFMRGLQVGADEVDGNRNAFFQQAAYAQPSLARSQPNCQSARPSSSIFRRRKFQYSGSCRVRRIGRSPWSCCGESIA